MWEFALQMISQIWLILLVKGLHFENWFSLQVREVWDQILTVIYWIWTLDQTWMILKYYFIWLSKMRQCFSENMSQRFWVKIDFVSMENNHLILLLYRLTKTMIYKGAQNSISEVKCTRFLRPWDFLCKSTGMGSHFLLQNSKHLLKELTHEFNIMVRHWFF